MVGNWMTQWKTNSVFILQMYFRLKCPFWWNYLSRESGVKIQVKRKTNKKNNFNWCFSLFFTCPYIIQLLRTLFQADDFWRMKCVTFFFFFPPSFSFICLPSFLYSLHISSCVCVYSLHIEIKVWHFVFIKDCH